jgi:hypothetical protein
VTAISVKVPIVSGVAQFVEIFIGEFLSVVLAQGRAPMLHFYHAISGQV